MYLHADVQRLLCTKESKIIHRTYIIAWHSIMAKSCFSFFLNYILKRIFNHNSLSAVLWKMLKCDDWLIILGNTPTLRHNFKRDITLIFTIYGPRRLIFTIYTPEFISIQLRPCMAALFELIAKHVFAVKP